MHLTTLLPPEAVLPHVDVRDKKTALKLLSAHAAMIFPGLTEREIYNALLEREQIGCTGTGSGVAIPHGRFEKLKTSHAIFARLDHAIEFGAADGKPVDLVFLVLTAASANTEHLKTLATVSKLLRDKELREALRNTRDAIQIHALLTAPSQEDAARI